jgi:hypothetical protein
MPDVNVNDSTTVAETFTKTTTPYEIHPNGRVIEVNTAVAAATQIYPDDCFIESIRWSNVTSASHLCSVIGGRSEPVFNASGTNATGTVQADSFPVVRGPLQVDDMDSGTLVVTLK